MVDVANELAKLSQLIVTTNNSLLTKIEESQKATIETLSTKLDATEVSIRNEIAELRKEDAAIKVLIDENKELSDKRISDLEGIVQGMKSQVEASLEATNLANERVAVVENRLESLERESYKSQQHGFGWNVEFEGIPIAVGDDPVDLEAAIIKILGKIDVKVDHNEIDKVHRLPSRSAPKMTIARFHSRKLVKEIHDNKRKLMNLQSLNIDLPGLSANSSIYIRASQCSYVKNLAFNARRLKRDGYIAGIKNGMDGRLSIKSVTGESWKINHANDLIKRFPLYDKFIFNTGAGNH